MAETKSLEDMSLDELQARMQELDLKAMHHRNKMEAAYRKRNDVESVFNTRVRQS